MSTSPVSALQSAERRLADGIHAAADLLDQIGTANVTGAVQRLQASAVAAKTRLAGAAMVVSEVVASVVELMGDIALELEAALPAQPQETHQIAQNEPQPAEAARSLPEPRDAAEKATVELAGCEPAFDTSPLPAIRPEVAAALGELETAGAAPEPSLNGKHGKARRRR